MKAVQEISNINDAKDSAIKKKDNKIHALQQQLNKLKALIVSNGAPVNRQLSTVVSAASLPKIPPTPFGSTTTINYTLPLQYNTAKIVITDKSGRTMKEVKVVGMGKTSLTVDASTLASGTYEYSLIIDSKLISAKQMTLTK